MESASFLGHYAEMPDLMRWRYIRRIFELNQPPPQDTFWRCRKHANFAITPAALDIRRNAGRRDRVGTPLGDMRFHFLIDGTGLAIDLRLRPELSAIADKIAIWADRFTPPADEEGAAVGPSLSWRRLPFTERVAGTAPYLANIHNFTFGATPSMGLSRTSISGMKYGVRRLVAGLARDLYLGDTQRHLASLLTYDTPELVSTEREDAPTPDATPAPAA